MGATALSAPFLLNGVGLSAMPKPWFFTGLNDDNDRVLVLIRLNGGNDGLNTLIPLDQYGNLHNARANILIPENKILGITDTLGLHPSMSGIRSMFDSGKVGIVQSVGYPNQNRSHFKSIQIWNTGQPEQAEQGSGMTGWLGRNLDSRTPDFPIGYPNGEYPDPFAITMGNQVSETCQGQAANYSIALNNPFALGELAEWGGSDFPGTLYGDELRFLRDQITQSNAYFSRIEAAAESGDNTAEYPDTTVGQQLKNIALMISGGLKTKVYVITLSGFDTHARQIDLNSPLTGRHAELLTLISEGLYSFQQDLFQQGLDERVIGMTFSEFGRQIRSNASNGTDHGTAAPLFLFGSCVNPRVLGENPEIPDEVEPQEGLPMQYDFRDVYGSVLMDWFDTPEARVREILYDGFQHLPVLSICDRVTGTEDQDGPAEIDTRSYPNPFRESTTIAFHSKNEWVRLSILDAQGREIEVLTNRQLLAGEHQLRFDGRGLPAGNYYYRLVMEGRQKTKLVVKVR